MKRLAACMLAAALLPAAAHDSWLEPAGRGVVLRVGNRYPVAEADTPRSAYADAGCTGAVRGPRACWVALKEHEVTLTPALVEVYFREIRPPEAVRRAWSEQPGWHERYRKFARIEIGEGPPAEMRRVRAPRGLPLEIVVEGDQPLRAGEPIAFRVLAEGKAVEGLSIELVSERSAIGLWARTDAQGRVAHRLPFAGRWLARAVWVEAEGEGKWRSRFATLAFTAGVR